MIEGPFYISDANVTIADDLVRRSDANVRIDEELVCVTDGVARGVEEPFRIAGVLVRITDLRVPGVVERV